MALMKVKLPPGMFRNGTEYESVGRWYNGNMVRWENGRLKPIGGWLALLAAGVHLTGVARGGIAFTDNLGFNYLAIGTNSNLYIGSNNTVTDMTPATFTAGRVDSILGAGYGAGAYGRELYGRVRTINTLQLNATTWQFDTFGNTIVMVSSSDQNLWQFDPTTGLVTKPAGSPTCLAVMSTNESFLIALGAAGNGRLVQWADVGSSTIWTPTGTNSAGSIPINSAGRLMAGSRVGLQNLLWTNIDVHLLNFVGGQGVYAPVRIGTACGLIGPRAWAVAASAAGAGETAYWMSKGGFFAYAGQVVQVPCEVQDFLWANINFTQAAKIYASPNARHNEIIWFFPSLNSTENDSYVIFNYKENIWYFGLQSALGNRTTYIDRGVFEYPSGVDPTGVVFEHEFGYLANGASRVGTVFAQSGPAEIGSGDKIIYSNLMLPDGFNLSALVLSTRARFAPAGPLTTNAPVAMTPNVEGYVPMRFSGRQVAFQIDIVADTDWALGTPRFEVVGGGGR
jgi:hypothetical protein